MYTRGPFAAFLYFYVLISFVNDATSQESFNPVVEEESNGR